MFVRICAGRRGGRAMADDWDVVIVGGGHNGLVAAAYLARSGLRVLVCERREIVGGAAVSERPFGPDYLVTSLSYVVSLLPADVWHPGGAVGAAGAVPRRHPPLAEPQRHG